MNLDSCLFKMNVPVELRKIIYSYSIYNYLEKVFLDRILTYEPSYRLVLLNEYADKIVYLNTVFYNVVIAFVSKNISNPYIPYFVPSIAIVAIFDYDIFLMKLT
jgi:hypothetical protein